MKAKTKKLSTNMQKELDMFRKLSMHMVANKIFLEYKIASCVASIEPESFVEECIRDNFSRIKPKMKNMIWNYFLANLVLNRKRMVK